MALGVSGSLYDLSGNKIEDTYQRVVQIGDDGNLYNGTGSLLAAPQISGSEISTKCFTIAMAIALG